ncbi:arginase family protein [Amycolatopsis suaedae]|uniref:Arginase family protein n=1 Tax=Amycolatopsis suaedae TaxID=2510978 RepID=A0A4Q7J341_9PSEU|nr:arginase family protein [Amycolatopsis suaedae]RZQ61901.1 arginase family protein [Amycolatopsis suaedae]
MVRLILSPYDSGRHGERMGAGPGHLLDGGAAGRLGATEVVTVELENPGFPQEVRAATELQRAIAREAALARSAATAPVVLSGNCNATVGVVAGMTTGTDDLAVLWLDAHGDLNTPDTTTSGFVDGMGLSVLTGRCWPALAATVPGFRPVPDEHVLLIGARDLDPAEEAVLAESAIRSVPANAGLVADAVRQLPGHVRRVHLHVDLDVHDALLVGRANEYAVPGGPGATEVRRIVEAVAGLLPVVSATFAAYDPAFDTGDAVRAAALDLLELTGNILR